MNLFQLDRKVYFPAILIDFSAFMEDRAFARKLHKA